MNFSKRRKLIWEQDSQERVENLKTKALLEWLIENGEVSEDITLDDIVQSNDYYKVSTFEVDGMEFGVGTEYEMDISTKENISDFVDDEGLDSFNKNFVEQYLDVKEVVSKFEDIYDDIVREEPDEYLREVDRMLSKSESEQVDVLENRISGIQKNIEQFENMPERKTDRYFDIKIGELKEALENLNEEIEDIKSDPSGDFNEEDIQEVIDGLVDEVRRDPLHYVTEWDIPLKDVIDVDELIQGMVDLEGYEALARYDGVIHEKYNFYIFRID